MTLPPPDREDLEARAERCIRRGELGEAVTLLRALLQHWPDDAALSARLAQVEESLQPSELLRVNQAPPLDLSRSPLSNQTPEQEGERLVAIGDYSGALAAYRRALAAKPDNELLRERLAELFPLAQGASGSSPTDSALPLEREQLFRALLDRISSRKRLQAR